MSVTTNKNYIKIPTVFLVSLLCCFIYFFWHFTVPVIAAFIMCFASWPLYRRLQSRFPSPSIFAPSLMIISWLLVMVLPLGYLGALTYHETQTIIKQVIIANQEGSIAPEWVSNLPLVGKEVAEYWSSHLSSPGQIESWFKVFIGTSWNDFSKTMLVVTASVGGFALSALFCLITLFFLYKDGSKLLVQLDSAGTHVLKGHWPLLSRIVPRTVSATVIGMTTIAIAEGFILGFAYYVAGAPSPLILGVITGFMAMIPGGAPLAFTAVSMYLVATGNPASGAGLFVWGCVELFIIDKTIRPMLVGGPVKLPFLPTFFGLIGGVKTMGVLGLFVGPVLMALVVSIWRAWIIYLDTAASSKESPKESI